MSIENYGRAPTTKWPGLEQRRMMPVDEGINIYTRSQEVELEVVEAAAREEEYGAAGIDIDLDRLKFSCDPDQKHTTIDLISITDEDQRARITTNDHVVYTRIKKLMAASAEKNGGESEWFVEDLKFNRTGSAVFFVTVTCPLLEARKIFNRYLQNRHDSLDNE
jgi:hypothetical protein